MPPRFAILVFLVSFLPSAAVSATVRAIRVPDDGIQPQAVTDARGNIHLIYYRGDPAHGNIYYVRSSDEGQTWSSAIRVNSKAGSAVALGTIRGGEIAAGRNGHIYVVWNGSSAMENDGPLNPESGKRGMPLLYSRLNDAESEFEPERNLMSHTFGLDGGGTVAADAVGDVYVAWHGKARGAPSGEAGRQVWVAKSTDDGKVFSAEAPATSDPTGACGCCGMAMYADGRRDVYALYRSATQNVHRDVYLLWSSDRGKTYSDRELHAWNINACPMSSMAFGEGDGKVEAAWETGGQVYFENVSDGTAMPIPAPGPEGKHKHPRVAVAANGETLLAWAEGTGWNRGGSVAWQLYDSEGKPISGQHAVYPGLPTWSFAAVTATHKGFLIIY